MSQDSSADTWELELYLNDNTRRSLFAKENLSAFCDKHLNGRCHIEVIDLAKRPELGFKNNICATPTLIKRHPSPVKTLVGDLSDTARIIKYLDIEPLKDKPSGEKTYREGLRKQDLSSKGRHLLAR